MNLFDHMVSVDRALVSRGTFYDFFCMAWPMIDPAPLVRNWHQEEVCNHLEAMSRGEIRKLIITIPPGFGKSNTVGVLWNSWEWIKRPKTKFLYASFDPSLVGTRDGGKVIKLLSSDWFRIRWGDLLERGTKAASAFENVAGGFRFATSPGGKGTGRHADIRAIDDPIKPRDANGGGSVDRVALRTVSDWRRNTWASRGTDIRTVRDLVIMQRIHEDDSAGESLATGQWVHLNLPMLYERGQDCKTQWGGDRRTVEGELLFPERYPAAEVQNLHDFEMGPDVFAAQCQQRPSRAGGGIFRREWWRFYHTHDNVPEPCLRDECFARGCRDPEGHAPERKICKVLPERGQQVQSWDCTFKKSDSTDYVAGGVFKIHLDDVFVMHVVNERMRFGQTVQAIRDMSLLFPHAYEKLVEDKANGPAVEDVLNSEIPGLTLVTPMGGKPARANAGSIYMSSGHFYVPHPSLAPWVWGLLSQHEKFPRGANDDMVDMTSQLLVNLRKHGSFAAFSAAMAKIRNGGK